MNTVFILMFLVSLGFLGWGLAAPRHMSKVGKRKVSRKSAGLVFGCVALVLFVLVGTTAAPQPSKKNTPVALTNSTKAAKPAAPKVTTSTVTETEDIPFASTTAQDSALNKGATKVTTPGVNGIKTRTFQVTYTNNVQTDKKLLSETTTKQPVTQVTSVGTKVAVAAPAPAPAPAPSPSCDPNYTGACVPIASDVDCAGGGGNGPAYVQGPVRVVGTDVYGLDRDGDGIGCN